MQRTRFHATENVNLGMEMSIGWLAHLAEIFQSGEKYSGPEGKN